MARINKVRAIKMFHQMMKKAEDVIKNPESFKVMLKDAGELLEGKGSGPLKDVADQLKVLLAMLNDYRTGAYRKVPVRTIVSIAGVMLYLVSPIDAIPDFIPVIGMLDDIFVLTFVWKQLTEDLAEYRSWRLLQGERDKLEVPEGVAGEVITVDFESL